MAEKPFDFSQPHPGSGLMYGPVSLFGRDGERAARIALEHTCAICGSFDASRGFKPAGIEHLYADAVWACEDPGCRWEAQKIVDEASEQRSAAA